MLAEILSPQERGELSEAAKSCATFARSSAQHSLRRTESHLEESRVVRFARQGDSARLKTSFQVLVVRSVRLDMQRADKLVRKLAADGVRSIDAVLLSGDMADRSYFSREEGSGSNEDNTREVDFASVALGEGDVSTVLSLFEHISLRVFYVPGTRDPPSMLRRRRSRGDEESASRPPKLTNLSD